VLGLTFAGACAPDDARPDLHVFAASSLERVLTDWTPRLEAKLGVQLSLSFGSSPVVARQVVEGAPADVLITADRRSMQIATQAAAVGPRSVVARNRLALVVQSGNPDRIESVQELARRDLKVVLCDPDVPCGRLAAALLAKAGVAVNPVSLEENVSAAVAKVELGEADATIAYGSDVHTRRKDLAAVPLPEAEDRELEAVYPAGVVTRGRQRAAAQRLIELLVSPEGTAVFVRAGFLAP